MASLHPALELLLKTERSLWRGQDEYHSQDILSTGYAELDKLLPAGGWSFGTLTELLVHREGIGEFSLLLPTLKNITTKKQWVALVNPPHTPYSPALTNAGVTLEHLLVVEPDNDKDTLWAAEQLLRTGTFTAVIIWVKKTSAKQQRRLQLAAEEGGCCAFAYRDAHVANEHSPAALRILLDTSTTDSKGLKLELIKVRGGATRGMTIKPHDFDKPQGIEWPARQSGSSQANSQTNSQTNSQGNPMGNSQANPTGNSVNSPPVRLPNNPNNTTGKYQ